MIVKIYILLFRENIIWFFSKKKYYRKVKYFFIILQLFYEILFLIGQNRFFYWVDDSFWGRILILLFGYLLLGFLFEFLLFLQMLIFKIFEFKQFFLGMQKSVLSEVLVNIFAGILYRRVGSFRIFLKLLKVIYIDLLGGKIIKLMWVLVSVICFKLVSQYSFLGITWLKVYGVSGK